MTLVQSRLHNPVTTCTNSNKMGKDLGFSLQDLGTILTWPKKLSTLQHFTAISHRKR